MKVRKNRLRRTMLFIPGNDPGMLRDCGIYGADSIMLDLEDSVSLTEKDAARFLVRSALQTMDYGETEVLVRINALEDGGLEDLRAVVPLGKALIRLPKTETAEDVLQCEREISRLEAQHGLAPCSTGMMAAIESAKGILNAYEIAVSSPRLVGIALGAEDYVTDLKTTRSLEGTELFFGRSMVLHAARAAGIAAIDCVYSNVDDEDGLVRQAELIHTLGFDGKSVIHPRQIEPIHRVFTPTQKDINKAVAVIRALQEARQKGSGVISLNGKMVDRPIVLRAVHQLEQAKAAGVWQNPGLELPEL
jgi:citrate lyase subunit beta/citryl-CoA lyase